MRTESRGKRPDSVCCDTRVVRGKKPRGRHRPPAGRAWLRSVPRARSLSRGHLFSLSTLPSSWGALGPQGLRPESRVGGPGLTPPGSSWVTRGMGPWPPHLKPHPKLPGLLCSPHFTDEETKAHAGQVSAHGHLLTRGGAKACSAATASTGDKPCSPPGFAGHSHGSVGASGPPPGIRGWKTTPTLPEHAGPRGH